MPTIPTAAPLSLEDRKALVRALVESGKLTERQAAMIDIREPTPRELAMGEEIGARLKQRQSGAPRLNNHADHRHE